MCLRDVLSPYHHLTMYKFCSVKGQMMRRSWTVLAIALLIVGYAAGRADLRFDGVTAQGDCQTFPETGKQACGDFLRYWKANGGLAQQGFPISDPFDERSETDGKTYRVQYFERAVFELHPELPEKDRVLLTLLGSQKYKTRYNSTQPSGTPMAGPTATAASTAVSATNRYVKGDVAVTYHGVRENPPTGTSSFQKPKAGNRCVGVDVTIESTGGTKINYNPFYLKLQTADDRQYGYETCSSLTPLLSAGDLQDGRRVRGWVTFEVPVGVALKSATWEGVLGNELVTFPVK